MSLYPFPPSSRQELSWNSCVIPIQMWYLSIWLSFSKGFVFPTVESAWKRLSVVHFLWGERELGKASLVAQLVKNLPATWETWIWSLGWEVPLEKGMATHASILAWRIPWTVQSMGSQRVRHDWAPFTFRTKIQLYLKEYDKINSSNQKNKIHNICRNKHVALLQFLTK